MDGCATYDDPFADELDWSFIPGVYGENEMRYDDTHPNTTFTGTCTGKE
jgi:hypothetical protein